MKEFLATKFEENLIELTDAKSLGDLYDTIMEEENFLLKWKEGDVTMSEVIVGANIIGKVRNGDVKLTSKTGGK